eukprot:TRINITY_DN5978_c0_g1_i1.p1 TRINITY_DN5978_c0_g1~~TRINITY_DN5978_c0_g1_i1.p1  ORF type:complete len:347 (-),score=80.05 TRINITY_DN5978_c0_g1_i1:5-1045(-)
MFKKWYRSMQDLRSFEYETSGVPRVSRMTKQEFVDNYDRPRRPCIFTDIVPNWPSFNSWSPDQLVERFGDCVLKCAQYNIDRDRVKMTVAQYVHYMRNNNDDSPLYVFDSGFADRIPQLLEEYEIPEYFWVDYFSVFGPKRPPFRWVILGPQRSGTSFHVDPNGTGAWNALLHGRKRWAIYPPDIIPPGIRATVDKDGYIIDFKSPNMLKWYYEVYPTLPPYLRPIEIIQRKGDMIYVPPGWWHGIVNIDETVSCTQNFVNEQNLNLAVDFLYNQGEKRMLEFFQHRLQQITPEAYKYVKRKTKKLEMADRLRIVEEQEERIRNLEEQLLQCKRKNKEFGRTIATV